MRGPVSPPGRAGEGYRRAVTPAEHQPGEWFAGALYVGPSPARSGEVHKGTSGHAGSKVL